MDCPNCKRMREALNRIASWDEGPVVTSRFDEPGSATIAREALAPTPIERGEVPLFLEGV